MILKKCGVVVDCGRCEYASSISRGSFEVTVPVSDTATGTEGTAKLLCCVSSERHEVELKEWNDPGTHPIRPSPEIKQRLFAALDHVASHRICGNRKICPSEVVQMVEKHSRQ
jgi:hypothetical protein